VILSQQNQAAGIAADDDSSVSFGHTVPTANIASSIAGNNPDIRLTFGAHLTYANNIEFTVASCDATSLIRGPNNIACPR
jgi:hypothetical protein